MHNLDVKLMADSAAEISAENAEKYGIEIIPMIVTEGCNEYLDGVNFDSNQLLEGMLEGKEYKTSQITLSTYIERFEKYAKQGRELICFVLSTGVTSSYDVAQVARKNVISEYPDAKITVIDSKCCAQGYGLVVMETARFLKAAGSVDEVLRYIEYLKRNIVHLFTVEDMEYLFRGGRVSRAQKVLGNMLAIKPLMDVDPEGRLRTYGKARGTKNLIKMLIEKASGVIEEAGAREYIRDQVIAISSGVDEEVMMAIKHFFETEYGVKEFILQKIGATIGAHTGPYMTTFYFFKSKLYREGDENFTF